MLELVKTTLLNPLNDLEANIRSLELSNDREWHIDRHVLDVDEHAPVLEACIAATELARMWIQRARALRTPTRLISHPYVIVDDTWITQDPESPSPHVYICISRDPAHFIPAEHSPSEMEEYSSFGINILDEALLIQGRRLFRPVETWDSGCWLITFPLVAGRPDQG